MSERKETWNEIKWNWIILKIRFSLLPFFSAFMKLWFLSPLRTLFLVARSFLCCCCWNDAAVECFHIKFNKSQSNDTLKVKLTRCILAALCYRWGKTSTKRNNKKKKNVCTTHPSNTCPSRARSLNNVCR